VFVPLARALGVIVVEATRNSGALHTVRHAVEQGREVFAVPGRIDSLASEGCHDILRDGATLIRHADDVLQALGPLVAPIKSSDGQTVRSCSSNRFVCWSPSGAITRTGRGPIASRRICISAWYPCSS
jgi:predicted Rossmann fold nucleotide-binding protein DprA/Smf involved in DNA uptake